MTNTWNLKTIVQELEELKLRLYEHIRRIEVENINDLELLRINGRGRPKVAEKRDKYK